ncbi:MAG: glutamate-1-semialdehyde 2,1-aminomutase [Bryobacterales bacterium]|nr:glutamate-1-semialdehyde 2,1-aminomutase [Bryobacteraceae bacterium]MCS7316577.1 glutamate-1-semialdehyde 2,1-aminomutase [Bryobacteraceae bacterium]MDW8355528.1 glutamate-1-semialdehyde 2,1-aminomutase [Bryobacterales bacterium]
MNLSRSQALFERAQRVIPGGVNSPVRAFRSVGGTPPFMVRGDGACLFDADGNAYLDYVLSWGPLLLGHRHPAIVAALEDALRSGTSFGAPTEREVELAEAIRQAIPSMEMVRLVNSGTEATMSAIRVARGYTRRELILKFDGCYHGHVDSLLVKAGSGVATLGLPDTAGVPGRFTDTTITAPYNSLEAVEQAFRKHGDQIAAVIVEPVAGNMGCVPPVRGFLQGLRAVTARHGALLIFDEVMTGFRLCYGGAQQLYGVQPDLTTLGKVIGGGLPVGAYGGRADIMAQVAPCGPVYQAGTLAGNPLAVAAGLATLRYLQAHPQIYGDLERRAAELAAAAPAGVTVNRAGSMFTFFFTDQPVTDYASARRADTERFARFFHFLLERGIYFPPSQFEAAFLSAAHTEEDVRRTAKAIRDFFAAA